MACHTLDELISETLFGEHQRIARIFQQVSRKKAVRMIEDSGLRAEWQISIPNRFERPY